MSSQKLWRINGLLYKGKTAHDACSNANAEFSTARIELVALDVGKTPIEELMKSGVIASNNVEKIIR